MGAKVGGGKGFRASNALASIQSFKGAGSMRASMAIGQNMGLGDISSMDLGQLRNENERL